jgi:hypothetical protein
MEITPGRALLLMGYGPRALIQQYGVQGYQQLRTISQHGAAPTIASARREGITLPDVVTVVGYGLGVWWSLGGPSWAGLASVVADEIDGRLARATGTSTSHGSSLDWGADVALTPLALARLGKELGMPALAQTIGPPVLLAQAMMRGSEWRPTVGSARAAVTIAAIGIHERRRRRGRRFAATPK